DEVNELRAERLAKTHDPLALMAHSQNSFNFPTTHKDQSSFPINNKYNPQPSLNQNFMQPPMTSLEDINDPTEAMNTALILFAKAFQLAAPTNNNQRTSSNPYNHHIAQPVMNMGQNRQIQNVIGNGGNQFGQYAAQVAQNQQVYNAWQNDGSQGAQNAVQNAGVQSGGNQNGLVVVPRIANQNGTGNVVTVRAEGTGIGNQARCYNCKGLGHIVRNCTARPRRRDDDYLQTQLPIAQKEEAWIQLQVEEFDFMAAAGDLDKIEEVNANCILMTNLYHASTSETSFAPNEETRADQETVYRNLVDQVAQEKYEKLEKCYQKSVYQEQCLTKKINALHLSSVKQIMTLNDEISNLNKQLSKERVQNFEIQFLQEAAEFVRDFKSLSKEADESLDKQKSLELEIERLLKTSVSHDIMSIMQNGFVDAQSDLRTELDPQLKDLKGKSSDTLSASNTLDPLNQMLESNIVELEFQVVNYESGISHLKTTYKNLFDSITSNWAHAKLYVLIYENAQLRAWVFKNTSESMKTTSGTSVTSHVDKPKLSVVTPHSKKLHASIPSHSVPQPREFNVVKHRNVIAPEMFKINPSQTFRVDLVPNKQSSASIRTNLITNFQRHVIVKENVSSNMITVFSTGLVHTARTRRPQPKGNTRNARVLSASKSSEVKKNVTVEDHRRTLLLSKNQKTMSSECNNIKLAIQNDKSKIVCDTCKQCLVTANHDACLLLL
nr:hypothetical protein [Tanacetum cinerariifolium]